MKQLLLLIIMETILLEAKDIQREQVIMGTFASISLKEQQIQEIQKGFKLLKKIEHSLSSYNEHALLYRLNKNKKIKADTYLLEAIQKSLKFYKQSNGYFNITIGSVTKKLYHFGEDEQIPKQEALTLANTDIKNIHMHNDIITLEQNTTLDLGGMGKGYAVDELADYYREQNITHGIIALSGDIQALHPTNIYIDSPFTQEPFIKLKTLNANSSISTSGTYRRYVEDKKHHHLINPKTKEQGKSFVSITLITQQDNTLIDAMATAIGVMSEKEALMFLINHPHIGYILVRPNGNVIYGGLNNLSKINWF